MPFLAAKKVAEVPEGQTAVAVQGVGIVTAGGDKPAMLNGQPIAPTKIPPKSTEIVDPPQPVERKLTGADLERRQRQLQYLRERGALSGNGPAVPLPSNAIDEVVMTTANPYLSLFREYRSGALTLEEMVEAIDTQVCGNDEVLRGYEYRALPSKPDKLIDAEEKVKAKFDPEDWQANIHEIRLKLAAVEPTIAAYLSSLKRIEAENAANLWYLREMLARQAEKNQVFGAKIRQAIYTHNEAA